MYPFEYYCPYLCGECMYADDDMYRTDDDVSENAEQNVKADAENAEENKDRQFPGASPQGAPGKTDDAARILRMIEKNNPALIRTMMAYNIPYWDVRRIIGRIISLTLKYRHE